MFDGGWIVPAILLVALLLLAVAAKRLLRERVPSSPYRRKACLFTRDERRFYDALRAATGDRFLLFAQMRLIDLIEVPRGQRGSPYWYAKSRQKHVDFVLCDRETVTPLLAIELDGASHRTAIQQQRDAEKDEVLRQAGLPLLRIETQKAGYTAKALAAAIGEKIRAA